MELTKQQLEAKWLEHLGETESSIDPLVKKISFFQDFFHINTEILFSLFILATGKRYAFGAQRLYPDRIVYFVNKLIKPYEFLYDPDYRLSLLFMLQSDLENTEQNLRILSAFDFRNKNQMIMKRKVIASLNNFIGKYSSRDLNNNLKIDSQKADLLARRLSELGVISFNKIQLLSAFISNPERSKGDHIPLEKPNHIMAYVLEKLDVLCHRTRNMKYHIIAGKKGSFISNHYTKNIMTSKEWCAAREQMEVQNSRPEISNIQKALDVIF